MKLHYEIVIIDLPRDQWTHHHPWPVRLALAIAAALAALLLAADRAAGSLLGALSRGYEALLTTTERLVCAARLGRVAAAATRVGLRVIWDDLAYGLARLLVGRQLELMPAVA